MAYIASKILIKGKLRNSRITEIDCVAVLPITARVSNKKTDVSKAVQIHLCNTLHIVVDYFFVILFPLKYSLHDKNSIARKKTFDQRKHSEGKYSSENIKKGTEKKFK